MNIWLINAQIFLLVLTVMGAGNDIVDVIRANTAACQVAP